MDVKTELSWLQKHEQLILGVFLLGVVLYLGNLWINHSADVANTKAIIAKQQLDEQVKKNDDLEKQVQQQELQYQQLQIAISAQNAEFIAAISARNAVVQKQQVVDKTLPLPDLGKRWVSLLPNITDSDIQNVNGNLMVDDTASRATVSELEEVPTLQQNLSDEQKISANKDSQLSGLQNVNDGLKQQVSGFQVQLTDKDKSCKADVDSLKAQQRKRSRNWFLRGLAIGGAVAGYLLHVGI